MIFQISEFYRTTKVNRSTKTKTGCSYKFKKKRDHKNKFWSVHLIIDRLYISLFFLEGNWSFEFYDF